MHRNWEISANYIPGTIWMRQRESNYQFFALRRFAFVSQLSTINSSGHWSLVTSSASQAESPASLVRLASSRSRTPAVKFAPYEPHFLIFNFSFLLYLGHAARSFAAISLYSASGSFLLGAGVPGAFPPNEGMT